MTTTQPAKRGTHGTCAHCRLHRYIKSRGLCPVCYGDPNVRYRYDPLPREPAEGRRPHIADCLRCSDCRPVHAKRMCKSCYETTRRAIGQVCKKPRVASAPAICRHCNASAAKRPKRLCWTCYHAPGVRGLYQSESKWGQHGAGPGATRFTAPPLPDAPTSAPPGSGEKIAVMENRVKAERTPHHPADARYEGDPRPLVWMRRASA